MRWHNIGYLGVNYFMGAPFDGLSNQLTQVPRYRFLQLYKQLQGQFNNAENKVKLRQSMVAQNLTIGIKFEWTDFRGD